MANQTKKKYVNVGAMLQKKENDEQGRPDYWIKLDPQTVVTVNGVKVTALNIQRPTDKFDYMLKVGKITGEEFEEKVSRYDAEGDLNYVKFEVVAALESK